MYGAVIVRIGLGWLGAAVTFCAQHLRCARRLAQWIGLAFVASPGGARGHSSGLCPRFCGAGGRVAVLIHTVPIIVLSPIQTIPEAYRTPAKIIPEA